MAENISVAIDPIMDGYTYIATWDADNHGTCYPKEAIRIKTFARFLLEQEVKRIENGQQ